MLNHKYVLQCLIKICALKAEQYDADGLEARAESDAEREEFASGSAIAYREVLRHYQRLLTESASYRDGG